MRDERMAVAAWQRFRGESRESENGDGNERSLR